jgi:alkanesulfonate monooxygenase SsuD/methylene tetrahydromethanopterin reductase-like flavin-dependent oxidoreductase (luciferase family)
VPEPQEDIALRLHFRPYQRPHPPIAVAGVTEKSDTLVLAGERGYIPMSINFVPPRVLRTHWSAVEAGARQGGRAADRGTWRIARDVFVADTTAEARREALTGTMARDWTGYFFPLIRKSRGVEVLKADPAMPDAEVTLEYLADQIWIVGDPEEAAAKLRRLRDEVGGFGTLLVIGHEWEPREAWKRSMRLLVDEVLPRL